MPQTADVLALIGKEGVVVGSVAAGKLNPKDVDVVVREARPEEPRNPVFTRLVAQWPNGESLGPGHWWIDADPLPVEVHCYTCWPAIDSDKDAGMVTYRQARRGATIREVYGVQMYIQRVGE